jgi:hypothetical protein
MTLRALEQVWHGGGSAVPMPLFASEADRVAVAVLVKGRTLLVLRLSFRGPVQSGSTQGSSNQESEISGT